MDEIEFRQDGIAFLEESFGGLNTSEFFIRYDELDDFEIRVNSDRFVRLDELLTEGDDGYPRLNLTALSDGDAQIRKTESSKRTQETEQKQKTDAIGSSVSLDSRPEGMPSVPEVESFKTGTDERHYERLKNNPDSQPAVYRRLIRNEGEIVRRRFDSWTERHGFDPTGGSHNASLLILDRVTKEIERHGRGDDQRLVWVGE
ncbi:hypothetical protein [Halobacterium salinarum]|uniref:hypothetical protein n=1 Tax=Halobacterium salinarum TaxID=2242 RepID=UPI0025551745|nr:hypothetical protein [Halobacterium salinarum]MDL0143648.1 hypothetical protein [Halobacterium salinarum]